MTKKNKKITYSIIGLIVVLFLMWWGFGTYQANQNAVPYTQIENIGEHETGNLEGEITMVEFSDFQCPACKLQQAFVKSALANFPELKLIFKNFPLSSIHPRARVAAEAAESAGLQGKFWEMHDLLFENQEEWSNLVNPKNKFVEYAQSLELNIEQFKTDLTNPAVIEKVNLDIAEANSLGINATPTFIIDGKKIQSDQDFLEAVGQGA